MRKKLWIVVVLAALILTGGLLWYDASVSSLTRIRTRNLTVSDATIPVDFENVRIVFFSDIHAYANTDASDLDRILTRINRLAPDILIFGGDLLDKTTPILTEDQINELSNFLRSMDAPLGKYAVLGLHDENQTQAIKTIYNQSDFELLENQVLHLHNLGETYLRLAGVSSSLDKTTDLSFLTPQPDTYTILVSALPDIADNLGEADVDLLLSGSTHGGQVYLPLIGSTYNVGSMKYRSGKYTVNQTTLIVSNGLGTSGDKYRLFADPDLWAIRLQP